MDWKIDSMAWKKALSVHLFLSEKNPFNQSINNINNNWRPCAIFFLYCKDTLRVVPTDENPRTMIFFFYS